MNKVLSAGVVSADIIIIVIIIRWYVHIDLMRHLAGEAVL